MKVALIFWWIAVAPTVPPASMNGYTIEPPVMFDSQDSCERAQVNAEQQHRHDIVIVSACWASAESMDVNSSVLLLGQSRAVNEGKQK